VDAVFKVISKLTGVNVTLKDYRLRNVTVGEDAQGEAQIEALFEGKVLNGRAVSTDVIEASAVAFLQVINRVLMRQAHGDRIKPTENLPQ
jgi:2-isopropylmalate synthase